MMKPTISSIALVVTGVMSESSLRIARSPKMLVNSVPPAMFKHDVKTFGGGAESMPASRLPPAVDTSLQYNLDRRQMVALWTANAIAVPSWGTKAAMQPPAAGTEIELVNFGSARSGGGQSRKGVVTDRIWSIIPKFQATFNDYEKVSFKGNIDESKSGIFGGKAVGNEGKIFVYTLGRDPFPDVSSCEGISLLAKSNGYSGFKLGLGIDPTYDPISGSWEGFSSLNPKTYRRIGPDQYQYRAKFDAPVGEYGTVQIPFKDFTSPKGEAMNLDLKFLQNVQRIVFSASDVTGYAALSTKSIHAYGCTGVASLIEQQDEDGSTFWWYLAAAPLGLVLFFITRIRIKPALTTPPSLG